ncbi:MAG: branched-chain amino acid ABC transporter permease [Herpetosiphon sp.]
MKDVVQLLIAGLAYGSVYALVALGFVLLYNAVGVVNFAQGEFVMMPAFFSIIFLNWLHLPFVIAYLGTLIAAGAFGILFQRVAYFPLRHRPLLPIIISTLGASILLQNGALVTFGAQPLKPEAIFRPGTTISIASVLIVPQYLLIIGITVLLVLLQYVVFEKTMLGKQFQATAQDQATARLMGIRVNRMIAYTFIYSALLGGVAGILVGPLLLVTTTMGSTLSLKAFASAIVGGFGSIPGAIVGGLFLGVAEKLGARFISSQYEQAIAFVILIAFLLFRPRGLFGEKISEKA